MIRGLGCASLLLALVSTARAAVPVPTVTGPITEPGTPFFISTSIDLTALGYVQEEFFISGTATGYTSAAPLGSDGKWTAIPAGTAAYETRILVHRPADPARFNGTVVVEWTNVSGGVDAAPDWTFAHTLLIRAGFAWVGVSAQQAGIEGSGGLGLNLTLKAVNPARYGVLVHPGDSFSYDMFSQAAQAVRLASGVLGTTTASRVIAIGESQSAFRLTTYVNAIQPIEHLFDGFLIHSRGGGAAALSQSPGTSILAPTPSFTRDDLDIPVLTLESETDLLALGYLPARQRNTRLFRLWEMAGTAHADLYQISVGMTDPGPSAADTTYAPPTAEPIPGIFVCASPINAGPQHYVVSAAIAQLDRWIQTGRPPRRARRLKVIDGAFVLDRHGNVRGGIRTPQLDVPIAIQSGLGQTGSGFCFLAGTTVPFDQPTLASLYPTHDRYVTKVGRAAKRAVRRGFVLAEDAEAINAAAAASSIGN